MPSSGTRTRLRPISSPKSGTASGPIAAADVRVDRGEGVAHDASAASLVTRRPSTNVTSSPAARARPRSAAGAVDDADLVRARQRARRGVAASPRDRAAEP
jgi:hypothetical protein